MRVVIHWFRQDLRLADNPALLQAAKTGAILPIYILDEDDASEIKMGAASRVWLHYALQSLNAALGGKLLLFKGKSQDIIADLISHVEVKAVCWNKLFEPWQARRDQEIAEFLQANNIQTQIFNSALLWQPWENLKDDGTPYKVFTPYYKNALAKQSPRDPLPKPQNIEFPQVDLTSETIDDLKLLPQKDWYKTITRGWDISESGAQRRLTKFLSSGITGYKEGRNFPARDNNSRLSPYLHFGQISPHQVWHKARELRDDQDVEHFCSELGWREFSFNLLYHFPQINKKNLQPKFDGFPWQQNKELLQKWQRGQTGYPMVDAGMRELWQTGFMHNRLRMIVGSFLVKNLLIHWHDGERWFWDCLFDADLANNSASWQWVSGCGADAAPYFRIFNPVMQGERFDPDGSYIKKYVPELKNLPIKYLFAPWSAPQEILDNAGVKLGKTYPLPVIDQAESRQRAIAAFKAI